MAGVLALGLTIGGFALRRPGIAFLAGGFWLILAVYGMLNGTPWDITYLMGFMSIAGIIICFIDGAMILSKKEQEQVENKEDDVDPEISQMQKDREQLYKEIGAYRGRPT
jgi:hypothetical protein